MNAPSSGIPPLQYTPLERLAVERPVDRLAFLTGICAGRRVLDLGAMDETAWQAKRGTGTWLHEEISRTALEVVGFDNSPLVPAHGLQTAANAVIRRGDVSDPAGIVAALASRPEVIVAGELLEHLENPLQFLKSFAACAPLAGATLVLTTPNSTALHNVLIGLVRRESTHHDHLCIFSYKTLATLCTRAGFTRWRILPYLARFTEMQQRHTGAARFAVRTAERAINLLEWLFPLLSFGYIVRIEL
jgi:hypothetical protein